MAQSDSSVLPPIDEWLCSPTRSASRFANKGNLYDLLHRSDEALTVRIGMEMARDVAAGMSYLHGLRPALLHRDLKSPNLLCTGPGYRIKISDFGLSTIKADVSRTMTMCG